jgi:hypothetical protein
VLLGLIWAIWWKCSVSPASSRTRFAGSRMNPNKCSSSGRHSVP